MASEYQQWQEVKANYLKQIEKNLAQIDHPQRSEILANVGEHLDSKYAELLPEQKNWESFQQIITEMGPPEEYVELLCEESSVPMRKRLYVTERLTIICLAGLIGIVSYLIFKHVNQTPPHSQSTSQKKEFVLDEQVLGKWVTVDFVRKVEYFRPGEKQWTDDLYLKGLNFYENGTTSGPWTWTKGWLWHPGDKTKARYQIKDMQGAEYLFMEWMSGDVTIRGQKPWHYVLKKEK